ncbi:MAG: bifunctional folylpolyglutamate synthase/dihydrofolate synthase [Deltaproteobacteria bacterium]|nr:bifunctional folylpolyglutamate synthase/dihydrofolate synthase [Deltaproteobacteria bacterium]
MGVRLELERMEAALRAVGDPHRDLRFVHLAGTNGKGSTAAFLDAMLRAAGHRTGLFTSPHLSRFTERIRLGGAEIDPSDVVRLESEVRARVTVPLTFFEMVTLLALTYFRERGAGVVVLETGLGGRFDATNVVLPEVAVVTGVALDHTEYLGDTPGAIAFEKAGIMKAGRPVVATAPAGEALEVIRREAARRPSPLCLLGRDFDLVPDGDALQFRGLGAPAVRVPHLALRGPHQRSNAALALAAAEMLDRRGVSLTPGARVAGLAGCRWPGRLEELSSTPRVWVDAAHNPAGAQALAKALAEVPFRRLTLCVGVLRDKDAAGILARLLPLAHRVIAVAPRSARALPAADLAALAPGAETADGLAAGLARAQIGLGPDDLCLVAGSIFLVGEARELLLGEAADPVPVGDPLGLAAAG